MSLALLSANAGFAPVAPAVRCAPAASTVRMETVEDLKVLAKKCNPVIGYYNPLALGEEAKGSPYDTEAAIGFLRHAEIKHGRIAMFAFVGFIVQSNGIHFPWNIDLQTSYESLSQIAAPAAQWDALSTAAKLQIFTVIFALELWGEGGLDSHYMRGGKPGVYPSFDKLRKDFPHPIPFDLFDPFGLSKNASPEKKERGLIAELNNGRAAQLGIIAFMAEARVPGSVPPFSGLSIAPYGGECMAPFSASDNLPFVADMLKYQLPLSPWW